MKPALCFVAAALAAFFCINVAVAGTSDTITATRTVRVQDLDLASETDRAILDHRIKVAAHNVCKELLGSDTLNLQCENEIIEKAQSQRNARIARYAPASDLCTSRP